MRTMILNPDTGELIPTSPNTPNEVILLNRQKGLDAIQTPKVGDFIRMADGRVKRFCHDWGEDGLQVTDGGSFYLGNNGKVDYSGALDPSIPLYSIIPTSERREERVWFFDRDIWGAGRGVHTNAMFNVWEQVDEDHLTTAQWKARSRNATRRMRDAHDYWGYEYIECGCNY